MLNECLLRVGCLLFIVRCELVVVCCVDKWLFAALVVGVIFTVMLFVFILFYLLHICSYF